MCIRIRSFLCFSVLRFRFPSFGFQLDDDAAGAVRREEFQTCLHQVIAAYDAVVVLDTRILPRHEVYFADSVAQIGGQSGQPYGGQLPSVRLTGLAPDLRYRIREINLMPGQNPRIEHNDRVVSGDYLMKAGLKLFSTDRARSVVVELKAE